MERILDEFKCGWWDRFSFNHLIWMLFYRDDWLVVSAKEWINQFVSDSNRANWISFQDQYESITKRLKDIEDNDDDDDDDITHPTSISDLMLVEIPHELRLRASSLFHALCDSLKKRGKIHESMTVAALEHEIRGYAQNHQNTPITLSRNTLCELIQNSGFDSVESYTKSSDWSRDGALEISIISHLYNVDIVILQDGTSDDDIVQFGGRHHGPNNSDHIIHLILDVTGNWYTTDMGPFSISDYIDDDDNDDDNDDGNDDNNGDNDGSNDDGRGGSSPTNDEENDSQHKNDGKCSYNLNKKQSQRSNTILTLKNLPSTDHDDNDNQQEEQQQTEDTCNNTYSDSDYEHAEIPTIPPLPPLPSPQPYKQLPTFEFVPAYPEQQEQAPSSTVLIDPEPSLVDLAPARRVLPNRKATSRSSKRQHQQKQSSPSTILIEPSPSRRVLPERTAKRKQITSISDDEAEDDWGTYYQQLKDYSDKYGHPNVPLGNGDHTELAIWTCRQRVRFRSKQLCEDEITKLRSIKFDFTSRRNSGQLDRKIEGRLTKRKVEGSTPSQPKRRRILCCFGGCKKESQGNNEFCSAHGGGKRCQFGGCKKGSQGNTEFCSAHGGGKRCEYAGCDKGARSGTKLCKAHGGGKRCEYPDCDKGTQSGTKLCIAHGGNRCHFPGCDKGIRSRKLCYAHGGGNKCKHHSGCTKGAKSGGLCIAHGGGSRCKHHSGCTKGAQSRGLCKGHGGGKNGGGSRCKHHSGCTGTHCTK